MPPEARHDVKAAHVCGYIVCVAAVTSLDFSQRNPHMLGVGMHDGTIAMYDVRSRQEAPVLASTAETGKHADPVWKVRHVTQHAMSIDTLTAALLCLASCSFHCVGESLPVLTVLSESLEA